MPTLDKLRTGLTKEQRAVVTAAWLNYVEKGKWVPRRVLHVRCGGKPAVRSALHGLGGSVIFATRDQGTEVYQLTLLGVLLSDGGPGAERLLTCYLEWVRTMALQDPEMTQVESSRVQAALNLSTEETQTLGHLIMLGNFWGGGAGYGSSEWRAGLPHDVEDIPEDVTAYVAGKVLADYDAEMPFEEGPRQAYHWKTRAGSPSQEVLDKAQTQAEGQEAGFPSSQSLHRRLRSQA